MGIRYYVRRPVSKLWLDTDAQLAEVNLEWFLSAPNSATALVPAGIGNPMAEDGKPVWSKFRTELFVEEDGVLTWGGVCTSAAPTAKGTKVEIIGPTGWLQKVPFTLERRYWQTNVADIMKYMVFHSTTKPNHLAIHVDFPRSQFFVGDPAPPPRPPAPARPKGWTMQQYYAWDRYKRWKANDDIWVTRYKGYKQYELLWWESPYCGEEIDALAKQFAIDYREGVSWQGKMNPRYEMTIRDRIVRRRTDIRFEDGVNLAEPLSPSDDEEEFASEVIGLGAGEGRSMVQTSVGRHDDRLYQGVYVNYKAIRNVTQLRQMLYPDFARMNQDDMQVDQVAVWDTPGFASVKSLLPGDEVQVLSKYTSPRVATWRKIVGISRDPEKASVIMELERT